MRQALLAGVFLLATVVGVQGPPAPVDFDYLFSFQSPVDPGTQGDSTTGTTPRIPTRLVRTVVVLPTDLPYEAAEVPAKAEAAATSVKAELAKAMPR